ncbi:hypothetical protein HDE_11073 [Halotydeus destructor]|nr:hypothetical protein HDE_11073 [Halotydeus destructor]
MKSAILVLLSLIITQTVVADSEGYQAGEVEDDPSILSGMSVQGIKQAVADAQAKNNAKRGRSNQQVNSYLETARSDSYQDGGQSSLFNSGYEGFGSAPGSGAGSIYGQGPSPYSLNPYSSYQGPSGYQNQADQYQNPFGQGSGPASNKAPPASGGSSYDTNYKFSPGNPGSQQSAQVDAISSYLEQAQQQRSQRQSQPQNGGIGSFEAIFGQDAGMYRNLEETAQKNNNNNQGVIKQQNGGLKGCTGSNCPGSGIGVGIKIELVLFIVILVILFLLVGICGLIGVDGLLLSAVIKLILSVWIQVALLLDIDVKLWLDACCVAKV